MMFGLGLGGLGLSAARAPGFDPAGLFGSGAVGWVEPMIAGAGGTLFQDAAGTIPVTAAGQPVGLSKFTAGGQIGFVQATAANRPIYQLDAQGRGCLAHNGLNQWMAAAAIAWGSDEATICAGVRKLSDAAQGVVFETGTNSGGGGAESGVFALLAPRTGADFGVNFKGSQISAATSAGQAAPKTVVVTGIGKISADIVRLRINGVPDAQSTADQGLGSYGTYPLYAGARAGTGVYLNGARYPSVGLNRLLTEAELAQLEAWVNARTGAF